MSSLTGVVSAQKVTAESEGWLSPDGNRTVSIKVDASLTVRLTSRAGPIFIGFPSGKTKVGLSDPPVACGSAGAYRIKVTPGITG